MSSSPVTMLICILTMENSEEIFEKIQEQYEFEEIDIGENCYSFFLSSEGGYEEVYNITSPPGSIVLFDNVISGYGASIEWSKLEELKKELAEYASKFIDAHGGSFTIEMGVGYW